MGEVFAAFDPQLERRVALKLLRPEYVEAAGRQRSARLLREAQALARLHHPNVVTVYDVGDYGDVDLSGRDADLGRLRTVRGRGLCTG